MKIAIHQPNFCPWFPFFYKMAMVDKFVLLKNVQFEKNNYQNRFKYKDKWITKSVRSGMDKIRMKEYVGLDKEYFEDHSLYLHNRKWIECIAETLNIKTEICDDWQHNSDSLGFDSSTWRLIHIIKDNRSDVYVTNPEAKDKYLDEDLMRSQGIEIEYIKCPKHLQKHTFEIFEEYGIDGAIKQLPRKNEKNVYLQRSMA